MKIKMVYLALYGLIIIAIPCLSMSDDNQEADESRTWLFKRYMITEQNLSKAINAVKQRPTGQFLGEKLFLKLQKFINQELSPHDWSKEVTKAYDEILKDVSPISATAITMAHPLQEILYDTIKIIPD